MVRTKADAYIKVATKAPRKTIVLKGGCAKSGKSKVDKCGGNPYHPRQTPSWQKPITSFLKPVDQNESVLNCHISGAVHDVYEQNPCCSKDSEPIDFESIPSSSQVSNVGTNDDIVQLVSNDDQELLPCNIENQH